MAVFVLDARHQPLMPCTEKRARLLVRRGRAVVHRMVPFFIRLTDRRVAASTLPPVVLTVDPGSRLTRLALGRRAPRGAGQGGEAGGGEGGGEGEVHQVLHLSHLEHRGQLVQTHLRQRAGYRRRRRSANLRYRAPRFENRGRPAGWLPPSLRSRIGNVLTWARRFQRLIPLTRIDIERAAFDTALLQHPGLSGVEDQRGELWGWEVRVYLLEKFGRRCAYCKRITGPFELDHVLPRSRGGSDRVSNLALACRACNHAKDDRTAAEFGHPEVEAQAQAPFKDAAAVNATRYALCDALQSVRLPLATWTGGRTPRNRARFRLSHDPSPPALCVGNLACLSCPRGPPVPPPP